MEPTDLEEPVLREPHQVLNAPLLLPSSERTHLHPDTVVGGHLGEGRVPLDLAPVPRRDDGLRVVEDVEERDSPEGLEGVQEGLDEGLHMLVLGYLDVDPLGPLQPGDEEVEDLLHAIIASRPSHDFAEGRTGLGRSGV